MIRFINEYSLFSIQHLFSINLNKALVYFGIFVPTSP